MAVVYAPVVCGGCNVEDSGTAELVVQHGELHSKITRYPKAWFPPSIEQGILQPLCSTCAKKIRRY